MTKIFALGGDAHRAPSDTIVSCWAALAAGADGLALQVRADDTELFCAPPGLPARGLSSLDAGADFRAAALGPREQGAPDVRPWRAAANGSNALRYPRLSDVLLRFGRRTALCLCLPDEVESWFGALIETLDRFGLTQRVRLELPAASCVKLRNKLRPLHWAARLDDAPSAVSPSALHELGARAISIAASPSSEFRKVAEDAKRHDLAVWLRPDASSLDPCLEHVQLHVPADVVLTRAADATLSELKPRSLVFADDLRKTRLDTSQWAGGYSHPNSETSLEPRGDGFLIQMNRGVQYSGGGLVTLFSVHRGFDARVKFRVTNAQQATTFELAAIGIDPGYTELNARRLTSKAVNLTFDVHGAPPYASSERDEDNGYRFGWNNSSNLTRILDDWSHSSANMYNKYGRDVGSDGVRKGKAEGELRLIRNGAVFASFYRDETARDWVCSGAGLVSALPEDAFIRLAAKHWAKTGEPPANEVSFSDFELRQV